MFRLDRHLQLADHIAYDGQLLEILLPHVQALRMDNIEESVHHRGHTYKMAWAKYTFHDFIQLPEIQVDGHRLPGRIHLLYRRHKDGIAAGIVEQGYVFFRGTGIFFQVLRIVELRRIDKNTGDTAVPVAARQPNKFHVAIV